MRPFRLLSLLPLLAQPAWTAKSASAVLIPPEAATSATGQPMQIVLILTLLTFLPAIFMSITPFLRISIVLHFLRQAVGTQSTPSNQVLIGLALFLTILVMNPIFGQMYEKGWVPFEKGELGYEAAWGQASRPLHGFLLRFARENDIRLLLEVTKTAPPAKPADLSLSLLVPAYVLGELRVGFQIGAVLFLPFLIIDLIVAGVTLSIGMVQLPPVMLSAPFKILLFVLADGWNLVIGSLIRSFYPAT